MPDVRWRALKASLARKWRHRQDGKRVLVTGPAGLEFNWIVDHRYPLEMADGTYEHDLVRSLTERLEEGEAFLDVGANAGYLSLCAKVAVGSGTVVAFEPLPENVGMIKRIQKANPSHPFEVIAAAVAHEDGVVNLEVPRNRSNPHLQGVTWERTKPTRRVISVPSVRLRPFIDEHRPKIVKLDVEGAEQMILSSLGRPEEWPVRPTFFVELHGAESDCACRLLFASWEYEVLDLNRVQPLDERPPDKMVIASPPGG